MDSSRETTGRSWTTARFARLAEDHYYVTTSTANVETVEQWFQWWMADREMFAYVTNVTSGYSVINIAGPNAPRDTLKADRHRSVTVQVPVHAGSSRGMLAGVPSILLKIGLRR